MKKLNKKAILLTIAIVVVVVIGTLVTIKLVQERNKNDAIPVISLIGDSNIKLELNEDYEESGATASLENEDVTSKIEKTGQVDTRKIRNYLFCC